MPESKPWAEVVEPVVKKFKLSTTLGMNTTFNPEGSAALADLLVQMAKLIDEEITTRKKNNKQLLKAMVTVWVMAAFFLALCIGRTLYHAYC